MREDIIQTRGYNPAIVGNELSLRIASYPATARYLADRLQGQGTVACELCCGVGVSLIELANSFDKVIGVDNDPAVIEDCRENLAQAGVVNYETICGDVSDPALLRNITADVVLYDIPYWSTHSGKVDPERQNPNLGQLVTNITALITDKVVIYAPTHLTYAEAEATLGPCEYTEVFTNGKHDRNFIFLGGLIEQVGESRVEV
ncbi:MAG: class I SAM-dependent methyltransferase [Candidatus Saccharimonadales bacterium]